MAFHLSTQRRAAMSEINVTPLVDVMLVLLIIFMVTAPMMQEGISVELPQAQGKPITKEQVKEEIVISVSGPGNIFVNDSAVEEGELGQKVLDAMKKETAGDVYLRADKTVPYGTVVRIMATLKNAGVNNLGMITTPVESAPEK